ncbi:MAG: Lrp/AsnC ligand binding domain-containing protein [Candidatus Woesearchaeota archaeon]|jgi:DNA-binding Lrp family transcriptional regulator
MANLSAFLLIQTEVGSERNVYGRLSQIDEVDFLYELFGEWDIIAKIDVDSVEHLDGFISDKIRTINGIKLTSTIIISR